MTLLLALALGGVVGLSLGLVGAGGSILTVPALIYGLHVPVREAVPASLVLVGLIAAIGAITHARDGAVRQGVALRFGLAGVLGALAGARLSRVVAEDRPRLLLSLFAVVMLAAAFSLARRDVSERGAGDGAGSRHAAGWGRLGLAGLGVGALTGFFGVGGGFVIVPALALLVGLPTREAVATSLVVIAINCASGLVGHLADGGTFPLVVLGSFALGGAAGSTAGARLAGRWPAARLSKIFAVIVAAVAVYLLAKNAL